MRSTRLIILPTLLAVTLLAAACGSDDNVIPVPPGLVGRWTTTTTAYSDRYMDISPRVLIIGTGGNSSEPFQITRVVKTETVNGDLYMLHYADPGGVDFRMGLHFNEAIGRTVRLENQLGMTWRKRGR